MPNNTVFVGVYHHLKGLTLDIGTLEKAWIGIKKKLKFLMREMGFEPTDP
ncbi:hypothetical protein NMY3_00489 [Candidatus Nitrosocosmicus oleophilus]|uniref:Uncharacterized protein n=1 Tax=Candidatus Nitrosocosmicus oleophilus TaxID=1353260 RepID=A0A654LWS9_9ARCH|nr:hypothetical protein NMY3_00489 [Candidatus Nitrosocosmicus oleophilus]